MPAKKAVRVQQRRRVINGQVRSRTRSAVKRAVRSLQRGDAGESTAAVGAAVSRLDRAAVKGLVHRNAAARTKSRLMKRLNAAVTE